MNNKWKHGLATFELIAFPSWATASPGIKPISAIVDSDIGEEIILLISEPKHRAEEFEGTVITQFMLKIGLANTSFGPVCFLLFYFPDPLGGAQVTYENTINPKDPQQLAVFERLSSQKYWHVIISNSSGEIINFFEFPNAYDLSKSLQQIRNTCSTMKVTDFLSAKAEYERRYSIEHLLTM